MSDVLPTPLPRGRHGLSREAVAEAQRARMVRAMADALREKGFAATTVADVLRRAKVSRETFYQQFSSKLDCFLATFDSVGEVLVGWLETTTPPEGPPVDRFARAFGTYLDVLATERAYARLFLVDAHAAGPEAMARRAALQRRIVDRVAELLGARAGPGRFACEVLVAGVGALVTGALMDDDPEAVRALHEPVVDLVRRALAATSP